MEATVNKRADSTQATQSVAGTKHPPPPAQVINWLNVSVVKGEGFEGLTQRKTFSGQRFQKRRYSLPSLKRTKPSALFGGQQHGPRRCIALLNLFSMPDNLVHLNKWSARHFTCTTNGPTTYHARSLQPAQILRVRSPRTEGHQDGVCVRWHK